jgi:hypothetical protein
VSIHPFPAPPDHVAAARIRADHIEAAASLVHLDLATRVVICNCAVDDRLPQDWTVDDVPVHLDREADGIAHVTAGTRDDRDRDDRDRP